MRQAGVFDYPKSFKIAQLPKISVDRITRATNLYHTGFVQFEWEKNPSGLYFILQIPSDNQEQVNRANQLKAALHLLGEEGLGGERSSGAGRFELEWLDFSELPKKWQEVVNFQDGKYYTLLSLFWDFPIDHSFLEKASYDIQERGGWINENQVRRKMVRMFSEGSVFSTPPKGQLVDVTPRSFRKHRIYRSGISLSLPINVKEE